MQIPLGRTLYRGLKSGYRRHNAGLYQSAFIRFRTGLAIVGVFAAANVFAADGETAGVKAHRLSGVASCASSNCHGGAAPRQTTSVLQNEYVTWSKHDKHSQAYKSLLSPEGKRIGLHLGISAPEKEEWCLRCHSTFTENSQSVGPEFRLEDGVGCESCHGASGDTTGGYLREHTAANSSHERNVELGLTKISNLEVRSNLCVTCHYGSEDADVTHRLMGAGHPRLSFELDTFTALQPMHWIVDDDYKKRKGEYSPAQAWIVGQFAIARAMTNRFGNEARMRVHSWPELTTLACYSCHHSLTSNQWKSREYAGQPGELRLNIAAFAMIERMLIAFDIGRAEQLRKIVQTLENNFRDGKVAESTEDLASVLNTSQKYLLAQSLDGSAIRKLMRSVLEGGVSLELLQYEDAEQVTMGLSALLSQLSPDGSLYKSEMKSIYDALKSPSEFDAAAYVNASRVFLRKLS